MEYADKDAQMSQHVTLILMQKLMMEAARIHKIVMVYAGEMQLSMNVVYVMVMEQI